jgi:hypothetical protein
MRELGPCSSVWATQARDCIGIVTWLAVTGKWLVCEEYSYQYAGMNSSWPGSRVTVSPLTFVSLGQAAVSGLSRLGMA